MPMTGVEVRGDDTVVVKRVSGGPAAVEVLRREGERLRHATHPGVVSIIRSAPAADGWELVLSYGGRSLATLERPSVAEAATIVAGLASTMADLHEIGITHGRIEPSHVLVSDSGCPRLCGLGGGALAAAPEDDVASLGALLEHLLGGDEDPEPIPERRWGTRRRWRGWERRALLTLADQATAEDAGRRPTARRLAAAIAAAVPAAERGPASASPDHDGVDPVERLRPASEEGSVRSPRRALPVALAAVGVVLAIAAVERLRAADVEATAPPRASDPLADVRIAAPVPGSVVVEDGQRYRVGQAGDHLLVADWSCEGRPTPAIFRPSTDEVFVFDRWTASEPLSVRPTATVADAVEMLSDQGSDGCPELALRTAHGELVTVALDGFR
jgi:hypothetical protein